MLLALLMGLILVAGSWPRSALGGWLLRQVFAPAIARAATVERRHLILVIVLVVGAQTLTMVAPADMALVFAWDLSTWLDIVVGTAMLGATTRLRPALASIKRLVQRCAKDRVARPRVRAPRRRGRIITRRPSRRRRPWVGSPAAISAR